MKQRFKKMILMNEDGSRLLAKKENYSFSALNLLQRCQLFLKAHTIWKVQFVYESIVKKDKEKHFAYESKSNPEKPLVYSCSGCSSAAQMANYLAVQLDRSGMAEMSCIAGVGGNVKKLVRTALSGRQLITIDGCPLACSKACLNNYALKSTVHIELTSMGVAKKDHMDFDLNQAQDLLRKVESRIVTMHMSKKAIC